MSPPGLRVNYSVFLIHKYAHETSHDPGCPFCQLPVVCAGWLVPPPWEALGAIDLTR